MEDISVLKRPVTNTDRKVRKNLSTTKTLPEARKNILVPNKLFGEVDENLLIILTGTGWQMKTIY